jgi:hypothetical protein
MFKIIAFLIIRMHARFIDPIVDAVNIIKELIIMVRDMTFVQIVKEIVELFKHLPEIIMKIVDKVKETYKKFTTLIVEDPSVTVKCRTAIKVLYRYFNVCLRVILDNLSCLFTSISFIEGSSTMRVTHTLK